MASNTPGANHNVALANLYFDLDSKNAEGKVKCRKCEVLCKDNSGHGNLASHVKAKHSSCWPEELKRHLQGATRSESGLMDSYLKVTKAYSDEAKTMHSWIEWIVLADLPIYVVENDLYRKNSKLAATSYKTVTKYMTSLLEIVKLNIKRGLPKAFGIIFDGNKCVTLNIHLQRITNCLQIYRMEL